MAAFFARWHADRAGGVLMQPGQLHPRCGLCALQTQCAPAGHPRPEFPDCWQPLRPTRLDHARELLDWLTERHAVSDPRFGALCDVLLACFATDRLRFSEILEPSCSRDAAGWHSLRFSYGFPGFREDPDAVAGAVLALAEPFAAGWRPWLRQALAAARHRAVEHPIVGLAYDGPGRWRWKLYLQFAPGAGRAAREIVARLTGARDLGARLGAGALHLVGFDLGADGLTQVKFYVLHERLLLAEASSRLGAVALLDDLRAAGRESLLNVLAIHRLRRADDAALDRVGEIDFALAENDLDFPTVAACPCLAALRVAESPLVDIAQRWPIAVRRVSTPVGPAAKFNAYYVLTAMEGS